MSVSWKLLHLNLFSFDDQPSTTSHARYFHNLFVLSAEFENTSIIGGKHSAKVSRASLLVRVFSLNNCGQTLIQMIHKPSLGKISRKLGLGSFHIFFRRRILCIEKNLSDRLCTRRVAFQLKAESLLHSEAYRTM